ncbi:MAG: acyl-CoA/acyl-ACP dehydrogenase [Hespellia sp.]|nr:acyl-CoA/acyl-ACP dehydrogenase [Hespellia sp.]
MSLNLSSQPFTAVDEALLQEVQEFADIFVKPNAEKWEKEHVQPELLREAIRRFSKYYIAKEFDGEAASVMTISKILEILAGADYGFAFSFHVHNAVTMVTSLSANETLRKKYLPKLMMGEMIGAFLLTEPDAGSDAASIRCRAEKRGDQWILNGEKAWVTNAGTADLLLVFAQTGEGTKDIIGFLTERRSEGIKLVELYDMLGAHTSVTGRLQFTDCAVEDTNIAYEQGTAFRAALEGIDFARFGIASMCNGALESCLEEAIQYAKERAQFGKPIYKNQGLQWKFADKVTRLEASRLLTYQAAKKMDDGENATLAAAHCKKFATRAAYDGVSHAMQCMGANGLKRSYSLARQLSALSITFNTDGTSEICNLVIGRAL